MSVGTILTKHRTTVVWLILLLGLIEVALLGCFVWPSLYKTQVMELGMIGTQTIRENRFTGTQEIYGPEKWQRIEIKDGNVRILAGTEIIVGGAKPGWGGSVLVETLIVGLGVVELALVVLWGGFARAVPSEAGAAPATQPD
jgi:hypothetical protein